MKTPMPGRVLGQLPRTLTLTLTLKQTLTLTEGGGGQFFLGQMYGQPVPQPAILLKKRLWQRRFRVNFAKFLRTPFFTEHSGRLLLSLDQTFKRETKNMQIFCFSESWRSKKCVSTPYT